MLRKVRTPVLEIAYEQHGPDDGPAVVLLHGFPYDGHAYDQAASLLAGDGFRVIVPWLRGYGETRFLSADTLRSGQQAALGHDLLDLLDALGIRQAGLGGYDWGGRAACIVSALWPERARFLVTGGGYNVMTQAAMRRPLPPEQEHRLWYMIYFHTERGRAGLQRNRTDLARLLWQLWSPEWTFSDADFARSAASFDNPDFVEVVIQSYRHRCGLAEGDPRYEATEVLLEARPKIGVPAIALFGGDNGVQPAGAEDRHAPMFSGPYERRVLPGIGHNIPQEAPGEFARAVKDLAERTPT